MSAESKDQFDIAKGYWHDIKVGWETKKSFGWELSVWALTNALAYLDTEEAQKFLDEHFVELMRILGMQNSSKNIGAMERRCVEDCLGLSVTIVLQQLPHNSKFLSVLLRCLDSAIPFYAGTRINFHYHAGYPQVRLTIGRKFAELNGFEIFLEFLRLPETGWLGTDKLQIIMKTLSEQCSNVDDRVRQELVNEVMNGLLTMTEDQAKKENSDSVASLIRYIGRALSDEFDSAEQVRKEASFHQFWMKYALRAVQSGSLVLKLFGWDQINELVREAISTRPLVTEYEVSGAGTPYVNGRYVISPKDNEGSFRYVKESTSPDVPTLTLYRCVMKGNKGRYWFISNLAKDTDYYQHMSLSYQDSQPQTHGWTTVVYNNTPQVGMSPAPVVHRVGPDMVPDGAEESLYLFRTFPEWALQNDLLGVVFKHSPHREIINRSSLLVSLLAEADRLTGEHLALIWKTAVQSHDADAVDEIFALLVTASTYLTDDRFATLMDLALELVDGVSSATGSSGSAAPSQSTAQSAAELFGKGALFVEKFSRDNMQDVAKLSASSANRLIALVWRVYRHPLFENSKSSAVIQSFLTTCLSLPVGRAFAAQAVKDCLDSLPKDGLEAASPVNNSSSSPATTLSPGSPLSETLLAQRENAAARTVAALTFLLSKDICAAMIVTMQEEGVSTRIVEELARYIRRHRESYLAGALDVVTYATGLSNRFQCIRQFYGLNPAVKMSLEMAETLWQLVHTVPLETECLFVLFTAGAMSKNGFLAIADYAQFIVIFKQYICNDSVDWSVMGVRSYECFEVYFRGLQTVGALRALQCSPRLLPPYIGLDTLWRIVLRLPQLDSYRNAVAYLIKSYEEICIEDPEQHLQIVQRLFTHLGSLFSDLKVADNETTIATLNWELLRALDVLQTVVTQSKPPATPAHALNGCMQRVKVSVTYRRVTTIYNYNTQSNTLRTEKGSEVTTQVDVHPLHTVRSFRRRLMRLFGVSNTGTYPNSSAYPENGTNTHRLQFDGDLKGVDENDRLGDHGIGENCTVSVYSFTSFSNAGMGGRHNNVTNAINLTDDYDLEDVNDHSLASIGQTIANDASLFEILLQIADSETHRFLGADVADKAWALLMTIPSQDGLVAEVLACAHKIAVAQDGGDLTSSADPHAWDFLYSGSLVRRTYMMQIVDYLLVPSPDCPLDPALTSQFTVHFLALGGFAAVTELFVSVNADDDRGGEVPRVTLSVALHIIHHILFESRGNDPLYSETDTPGTNSISNSVTSSRLCSPAVIDTEDITLVDTTLSRSTPTAAPGGTTSDSHLLSVLYAKSAAVVAKLLGVASSASRNGSNQGAVIVRDALRILTLLLRSDDAAAQLTSNPTSQPLLLAVLRSSSPAVRDMAAQFAVQVGRHQPVVCTWLLEAFRGLRIDDALCGDLCWAVCALVAHLNLRSEPIVSLDWADLASFLVRRILEFGELARDSSFMEHIFGGNAALLGHLNLLEKLVRLRPDALEKAGVDLRGLAQCIVNRYLFPLPEQANASGGNESDGQDLGPLCATTTLKRAGFGVLSALLSLHSDVYSLVLSSLGALSLEAGQKMAGEWGQQISSDVKRADIPFAGLKNQGCTCYSNSLLQQLFMNVPFREAILHTPLRECERHTVSHMLPESIVGLVVLMEWDTAPEWRAARVVSYDEVLGHHTIQYLESGDSATFALDGGRLKKETGYVRIAPPHMQDNAAPAIEGAPTPTEATERELGAYRVLEELQRTFLFLKHSQRRFFDPRPLVEACRVLNLNFNVFQQNDASEFCDQLLDRLELACRGKHSGVDTWTKVINATVFGGKTLTQKIPTQCEYYEADKTTCGHWQSSRQESFLKIELLIRGKEHVSQSMSELVAGELMDGDNKISCDVCMEKKAAVRRTAFDVLPNALIVHLKRFDLDFTTFETVKLNSRLAFDSTLNMMPYTKEGIEAAERKQRQEQAQAQGGEVQYESAATQVAELDPLDYEYQLQGVLVHAGIAQGGHYYSFAKEPSSSASTSSASGSGGGSNERWFRFDDDDVSVFSPDQIPYQCFGGPQPSAGGGSNAFDGEDKSANALMLFYTKTRPAVPAPAAAPAVAPTQQPAEGNGAVVEPPRIGHRLVNGYDAFMRDLRAWNLEHLLARYVLDADLHVFIREIFESVVLSHRIHMGETAQQLLADSGADVSTMADPLLWYNANDVNVVPLQLVQFGVTFLLDVVLRCRERSATKAWVSTLRSTFAAFPNAALWFVQTNMDRRNCSWLRDFLLSCTDALARNTYVQLLSAALNTISLSLPAPDPADGESQGLFAFAGMPRSELLEKALTEVNLDPSTLNQTPASLEEAREVCSALLYHFANELMLLVAAAPAHPRVADDVFHLVREACTIPCLVRVLLHFGLVSYLVGIVAPDAVPDNIKAAIERPKKADASPLFAAVFEALAALIGVPQLRKVQLVSELSHYEYELLPEARAAFSTIYAEICRPGSVCANGMDAAAIMDYKERIGVKVSVAQAKASLNRFPTNSEGRLTLEGFLQYYCDLASYNPKDVWRDLHALGFRNDLSRAPPPPVVEDPSKNNSTNATTTPTPTPSTPASPYVRPTPAHPHSYDECQLPPLSSVLQQPCLDAICSTALLMAGLDAAPEALRAIARRISVHSEQGSILIVRFVLSRLSHLSVDYAFANALVRATDLLHAVLALNDGLSDKRLREALLNGQIGFAPIINTQEKSPLNCRVNDYDRRALLKRYVGFMADAVNAAPGLQAVFQGLGATNEVIRKAKGHMKVNPDSNSNMTENEDRLLRASVMRVSGAGAEQVNGDYAFHSMQCGAACYTKPGVYEGNPVTYTLYKCSVTNGIFQWFISIPPAGGGPETLGTANDIDFYYAPGINRLEGGHLGGHTGGRWDLLLELSQYLPPMVWNMSTNRQPPVGEAPAPRLQYVLTHDNGHVDVLGLSAAAAVAAGAPSSSGKNVSQGPHGPQGPPQGHVQHRQQQQQHQQQQSHDHKNLPTLINTNHTTTNNNNQQQHNGDDFDDNDEFNTSINTDNTDPRNMSDIMNSIDNNSNNNSNNNIIHPNNNRNGNYSDSDMEMNTADDDDDDDEEDELLEGLI